MEEGTTKRRYAINAKVFANGLYHLSSFGLSALLPLPLPFCGYDDVDEAREKEAAHGGLDDDEPEDVDRARGDEARHEVDPPRLVEFGRREQDLQRPQRREPGQPVRGRDRPGTDVRNAVRVRRGGTTYRLTIRVIGTVKIMRKSA